MYNDDNGDDGGDDDADDEDDDADDEMVVMMVIFGIHCIKCPFYSINSLLKSTLGNANHFHINQSMFTYIIT